MSGLYGQMNYDNSIDLNDFDKCFGMLKHRGPNSKYYCGIRTKTDNKLRISTTINSVNIDSNLVLANNILKINNSKEEPTILSNDRTVILNFDGEIYNIDDLKKLIHTNYNCSKEEIFIKLYKKYGFEETIKKLNGMFAIVLYDQLENKLYIARDKFGIIPLYYRKSNNKFAWSSEIKSLAYMNNEQTTVNNKDISENYIFCWPSISMINEIQVFKPGCFFVFDLNSHVFDEMIYFDIKKYAEKKNKNIDIESNFNKSIESQLQNVKIAGIQLSGGVDSTLIAAKVLEKINMNQIYLISLANNTSIVHDESKWIDFVEEQTGLKTKYTNMNVDDFIKYLEIVTYYFERPINDPAPIGLFFLSKDAKKDGIDVLFSGEGPDEFTGGYKEFPRWLSYLKKCKNEVNDDFLLSFCKQVSINQCKDMLNNFELSYILEKRRQYWKEISNTGDCFDMLRKMYYEWSTKGLLEKQNKSTMANSIECRLPYTDSDVMKDYFSASNELFLHGDYDSDNFQGKYAYKKLSERYYGKSFAFRKKQYIRVPIIDYMKNPKFVKYVNDNILKKMKERNIINYENFIMYWNNINMDNVMAIWKAINLELWCQLFIDHRKPKII